MSSAPALVPRASAAPATDAQGRNARRAWVRLRRNRPALVGTAIILALLLTALFGPLVAPFDPNAVALETRLQGPGGSHPLGTDELGRDVLSRLLYGARVSLWVGLLSVGLAALIGVTAGIVAGYLGGAWDAIIMRLVDVVLAFPVIVLAVAIVAIRGPGLLNVMLALGLVYWTRYARVARSVVLTLKEEEFILAARVVGASPVRVMAAHLLPNSLASLMVLASLGLGEAILAEAALSFLGLGIQPPDASWGSMLNFGMQYLREAAHLSTSPGLAIFVTVLGFNLLGDGLRDALDPRLRQ